MPLDTRRPAVEARKIQDLLKKIHLFKDMSERDIKRLEERLSDHKIRVGNKIFMQGDPADGFFIILEGGVQITREVDGEEEVVANLVPGDYFGETALLARRPRSANATATRSTTLLRLVPNEFRWLLEEFPVVRQELIAIAEGYQLARRKHFDWLGKDETIHIVARKHPAILIFSIAIPIMLGFLFALAFAYGFLTQDSFWRFLGASGLFVMVLWGVWKYVDWGNDFYIVTDKRVVWLEKIVLLYDSRQEAPLATILSVNVTTNQLQRILQFGDVIVRTFTGSIPLRNVGNPRQFAAAVEEYWSRVRENTEREKLEEIQQTVKDRLSFEENEEIPEEELPQETPQQKQPERSPEISLFSRMFENFLKVRFEVDGVITYRKHWFLLLARVWPLLVALTFLLILLVLRFAGVVGIFSTRSIFLTILGLIGITSPYWLYQYLDWRDDRYQVTNRDIIDLERRPLGRESRKSAPLENILSMEHRREGIIGLMLNFGIVVINVGETKFDFVGVHNPAEVQHEIFERHFARRRQLEVTEAVKERERMLDWLDAYHQNVREFVISGDDMPESSEDQYYE